MPKFARMVWAAAAAAVLACAPARAQELADLERCLNEDAQFAADVVFGGCNAFLGAGIGTPSHLALAYGKRGKIYLSKGEHDRAIADFNKAIDNDPTNPVVYNNRGIAYRAKGDNDSAIADYSKAIDIDPRSVSAHNNRGIAYRAKGDYDQAIADHTRAIEIDPDSGIAYNNRGMAYRAKGEYEKAIADHTVVIDIDPESVSAHHNRSLAHRANGDNDAAIEDATKAIEINPRYVPAYYHRGLAYAAKGDNDNAITDQSAVIELNPRHAGAYQSRALAYAAKGEEEAANADAAKLVEIDRKTDPSTAVTPAKATEGMPAIEKALFTTDDDALRAQFSLVLKADLGAQRLTVIENNAVVHVWPISSGTQGFATPTGTFQPRSANRMWYSRQYNWAPMPYAVFFNKGVAFHGTTAVSRLGRSASHGCVRLATSNAAMLYDLVHKHGFQQTQIVVFGATRHDAPSVAKRAPAATPKREATASSGWPAWAKTLFGQ